MPQMAGKQILVTIYITPEQRALLKLLHERTRVPMATYVREAIDDLFEKYQDVLKADAKRGAKRAGRKSS